MAHHFTGRLVECGYCDSQGRVIMVSERDGRAPRYMEEPCDVCGGTHELWIEDEDEVNWGVEHQNAIAGVLDQVGRGKR